MIRNLFLICLDGERAVSKSRAFERLVQETKRCAEARDAAYARGDVEAAARFQRDAMVAASSAWISEGLGEED